MQEEEETPLREGNPPNENIEYIGYSHAEHFGDGEKRFFDGSDTEYKIYIESNCCWKGGIIIGYSSDGDFS